MKVPCNLFFVYRGDSARTYVCTYAYTFLSTCIAINLFLSLGSTEEIWNSFCIIFKSYFGRIFLCVCVCVYIHTLRIGNLIEIVIRTILLWERFPFFFSVNMRVYLHSQYPQPVSYPIRPIPIKINLYTWNEVTYQRKLYSSSVTAHVMHSPYTIYTSSLAFSGGRIIWSPFYSYIGSFFFFQQWYNWKKKVIQIQAIYSNISYIVLSSL